MSRGARVTELAKGMRVMKQIQLGRVAADGTQPPEKTRYGRIIKVGHRGVQVEWEDQGGKYKEEWLKGMQITLVDDEGRPLDMRAPDDDQPSQRRGKTPTERDLEAGMKILAIFRHGSGPDQKIRKIPGEVDSVMRHGAMVLLDGERQPKTMRFLDLEIPPEEIERIEKEKDERAAAERAAQAERAERRRVAQPAPVTVLHPKEPPKGTSLVRNPLASEIDALIDGVASESVGAPAAPRQSAAPPAPVVPPVPTTKAPVVKPAPEPVVADPLQKLISDSAGAGERLLTKASATERERAQIMERVNEIKQQIAAKEEEVRALLAQAAAKDSELAKVNKAIDALAAIEALGDLDAP